MDKDQVPQDAASTYGGHRKLLYAVDADGRYQEVQSLGWEVESSATRAAIAESERLRDEAWQRAQLGASSPLEVHMHDKRMDVPLLAGASGIAAWRVRRHFHAKRFARLPARILAKYADALGLTLEQLQQLPNRRT